MSTKLDKDNTGSDKSRLEFFRSVEPRSGSRVREGQ